MKKNIISSGNSKNNFASNMLNPEMIQLFSQMLGNNQMFGNKKSNEPKPAAEETKQEKPEKKPENKPESVMESSYGDIELIYNNKLAEIIKNHDKLSRKLDRQ